MIGIVVLAVVSVNVFRDNIRYVATGDMQEYQQYTRFYPVFQWVNRSTPQGSRVLVILSSGQSYYLTARIGGLISTSAVSLTEYDSHGEQLDELMTRECYSYLLYEDRDWHDFRGGTRCTMRSRRQSLRELWCR